MNKKIIWIFVPLMISLFFVSFAIGRATAVRQDKVELNEIKEELSETSLTSENVKKFNEEILPSNDTEIKNEKLEEPPDRMLFPCGKEILKDYSQDALYSKTMDDWRAHTGIDYKASSEKEVQACWDGQVSKIYNDKLWGYTVEIVHSGNITSVYKNLNKNIKIKEGENMKGGQVIGEVGNSAAVESKDEPHLHFEIWAEGEPINPASYVY